MCFCFKGKISSVNFYLPQLLCSRRRTTLNIPLLDNLAQYVTLCLWLTKSLDGRECAASRNFSVILKNGKKRTYFQTGTTCQKNHVHFHIMKPQRFQLAVLPWTEVEVILYHGFAQVQTVFTMRTSSDFLQFSTNPHRNYLYISVII